MFTTGRNLYGGNMPSLLSRVAVACYRHRRRVLFAWVALVVAAVILGPSLAGTWSNSSRLPGTDSQAAQDVLAAKFPAQAGEATPPCSLALRATGPRRRRSWTGWAANPG